ncbi:MAG TPA: hypothetical protein VFA83_16895 [Acidimicrobiales bacterium]|nr:hypothetical protein [Acidimicrobiales bacterium]
MAVVAAACGRGTVQIAFHPKDGARYSYQVTVRASTVTKVGDAAPEMQSQEQVLRAEQTVLSVDSLGSRVQVRLTGDDGTPREFVVRFDRAAQLAEVQRIEGLPANVLGDLGLTEIFPAAAGAPPDRPLQPGDRWTVDEPVTLPGVAASHLKGNGRLLALGIVNGRKVATTETTFSLPVERTVDAASARILLTGTQHTTTTATRALVDGSVQEAHAVTSGTFDMTLLPPDGSAPALHGTLELHVDSTTRRLG